MITFQINDMTCGHCASTITKAVKATDTNAKVTVDRVDVLQVHEQETLGHGFCAWAGNPTARVRCV